MDTQLELLEWDQPPGQAETLAEASAQLDQVFINMPLPDALGGAVEYQLNTLLGVTIVLLALLQLQAYLMGMLRHAVQLGDLRTHWSRPPAFGANIGHHPRDTVDRRQQPGCQAPGPHPQKGKEDNVEGHQPRDQPHTDAAILFGQRVGLGEQSLLVNHRQQPPASLLNPFPADQQCPVVQL